MRLKWLSWAILGACIAAAVALFWPVRPLWMWLDSTPGSVQYYSQDGQWLYTVHIPEPGQLPYICQLNAATGELVKRILLEGLVRKGTPGVFEFDIRLSRDARTVFVGTQSAIGRDIDTWHLYDAQKGKRTSEAIMNVAHFNPEADSLNGRWFWTIHGIRGRSNHDDGVDIHSIETGQCILELRPNKDMHPRSIHFHPTNDQALVFWTNGKEHSYYQLIELPSGKEIKRFTLPTLLPGQRWRGIDSWEGDTLWSEYNEPHPEKPGDKGHYLRLTKRFDLR